MIKSPDFSKALEYENHFFYTCDSSRISKLIAQYNIFQKSKDVRGDIVECGVFKGASLCRLSMFREMLNICDKKIIAFDTFDEYPEANFKPDKKPREEFIGIGGLYSIDKDELDDIFTEKGMGDIDLIKGDIIDTVPRYIKDNPELNLSFINLDVDIYEPSVAILEYLWPSLNDGGILLLDDYNTYPGETKAVDEYFKGMDVGIVQSSIYSSLNYIVK